MNIRYWLLTVCAAGVVGGASYFAFNSIYTRHIAADVTGGPSFATSPMAGYLELSPEQISEVSSLDREFQARRQRTRAGMQAARSRLMDVLRSPEPSEREVDKALAGVGEAQSQMQRLAANYILDIKPVLNQEQRDRLFDLVGQRFCGQGGCGAGICPAGSGGGGHRRGWTR